MRTMAMVAASALLAGGCGGDEQARSAVHTEYQTPRLDMRVVYEDEEAFDLVRQGLYWHNAASDAPVDLESEGFLQRVVPLVNREIDDGDDPLFISRREARDFFLRAFHLASQREAAAAGHDGQLRFRIRRAEE